MQRGKNKRRPTVNLRGLFSAFAPDLVNTFTHRVRVRVRVSISIIRIIMVKRKQRVRSVLGLGGTVAQYKLYVPLHSTQAYISR